MSRQGQTAREVNFGGWLQVELDRRGWSRLHLAQIGEMQPSAVSKWALNQQRPSPAQCAKVAEALGMDLDVVLAAAGHRPRSSQAPGVIRSEVVAIVNHIPERLLAVVVPMLQGLTDPAVQDETLERVCPQEEP